MNPATRPGDIMNMAKAAPAPLRLLVEARTLIARPEAWTQGAGARDSSGDSTRVEHQDAVSWCATGALLCAMYRHAASLEVPPALQHACTSANSILTDTVRALTGGRYTAVTTCNDSTNHGCIVHTFDIAISDAERLAAQSGF